MPLGWRGGLSLRTPLAVDRDFSTEEVSMARFIVPKLNVLKVHRSWEDWVSAGLGVLLLLTLAALQGQVPLPVMYSVLAVGVALLALSLSEIMMVGRWEEVIQFGLGLWLALSVFVLDYGAVGQLRIGHFVIGALVAIMAAFEFWQDSLKKS